MDKKEARDILIGRIVRLDDVFWAAAPTDVKFRFYGVRDGAGDAFLFGVTHLTRCYQATETDSTSIDPKPALYSMGRPMQSLSAPEEAVCLYTPGWIAPVLLTVGQSQGELQITAHTSQSLLMGRIRCWIALWILERRLPEGITRLTGKQDPPKKAAKNTPPKAESPKKKTGASTRRKKKTSPRD